MAWDINGIGGEYPAEWQGTFKDAKPAEVGLQNCEEQKKAKSEESHQFLERTIPRTIPWFDFRETWLQQSKPYREQANNKASLRSYRFINVDAPRQNAQGMG